MARKRLKSKITPETPVTPAVHGYRMPAEWEPHESSWIAWPHRRSDWPGKLPPIPWVYGEIVRWLHHSEAVNIIVNDAKLENQAAKLLKQVGVDLKQIRFWRWTTDRVWTRDYGPTFLLGPDGKKALVDWRFNAWAKYPDWKNDDAIPGLIAGEFNHTVWQPVHNGKRVVLEGGSIDVNGQGLLLTTEECLLGEVQARNPDLPPPDLSSRF